MLIGAGREITPDLLPALWQTMRATTGKMLSLEDVERNYILEVLRVTRGKKVKAAKILGISRKTLLEKRKKYGLK
jgi:DNA-binding NtrC family response regulator